MEHGTDTEISDGTDINVLCTDTSSGYCVPPGQTHVLKTCFSAQSNQNFTSLISARHYSKDRNLLFKILMFCR